MCISTIKITGRSKGQSHCYKLGALFTATSIVSCIEMNQRFVLPNLKFIELYL